MNLKAEKSKKRTDINTVKEQNDIYMPFERYEIINNIRYDFQPSPSFVHQVIVTEINQFLRSTCHPDGIVIVSPMDVHLDGDNTVQPDVIFIHNENLNIINNQRIEGTPDLLVEILSPSTGSHDRIRKKSLYETFGVSEYWIVDPVHYTVDQFVLEDSKYTLRAIYGEANTITSPIIACVSIDVDKLFKNAKRFSN